MVTAAFITLALTSLSLCDVGPGAGQSLGYLRGSGAGCAAERFPPTEVFSCSPPMLPVQRRLLLAQDLFLAAGGTVASHWWWS